MTNRNNQDSELNPNLVILKDNKAKWYLPETRRDGYRNLHKINRYGVLLINFVCHSSSIVLGGLDVTS